MSLSDDKKLRFILCPPTTEIAKCVSKYLGIMTNIRKEIDMGLNPQNLNIYIQHKSGANLAVEIVFIRLFKDKIKKYIHNLKRL